LEIRWAIEADAGRWEPALSLAEQLCFLCPERPEGWIYRGTSFVELNQYADAYGALRQGQDRFPKDDILTYDLACVCCALGRTEEATIWLKKAIENSGVDTWQRALEDPDLKPIAKEVSTWENLSKA
jgi:tetratricopeptide (TPR) repeat protein